MTHIWHTPESADGERSMSQHAFTETKRYNQMEGNYYTGNRTLCNVRLGVVDENEMFIPLENIDMEELNEKTVCKKCLSIVKRKEMASVSFGGGGSPGDW